MIMKIDFCMITENVLGGGGVNKTVLHSKFPKHSFQKDLFDHLVFLQCNQLQPLSVRPSCCDFKLMHQKLQKFWPAIVNRKVSIHLSSYITLYFKNHSKTLYLKKKKHIQKLIQLDIKIFPHPAILQQFKPNRKCLSLVCGLAMTLFSF